MLSTPPVGDFSYRNKTPMATCIQNAQYADDLTLVAETRKELRQMLDVLNRACTRLGLRISGEKTKVLSIGEPARDHPAITLKGQTLEEVDSFSYLGSEVQQTGEGSYCLSMWRGKFFRSRNLSRATNMLYRSFDQWSCQSSSIVQRPGQ